MSEFAKPIYNNEDAARRHLEATRWPDGPFCPHCGERENVHRLEGEAHRPGLLYCRSCREQFSVTVGTVFERSHVPLHKWVLATHLLASSKKGMSAHQLHRILGVTYKTAWFMAHRIREAMKDMAPEPMGGEGQSVQADETYFGTKDKYRGKPWSEKKGHTKKMSVFGLVSGGKARTFHIARADAATLRDVLVTNVDRASELHTDEAHLYHKVGREFAKHRAVHHGVKEYVAEDGATTNAVENYFSVFKRGMRGIYQHCSEKHLQRYLAEFDFRYNARKIDDAARAAKALAGIEGKRLTYRGPDLRPNM